MQTRGNPWIPVWCNGCVDDAGVTAAVGVVAASHGVNRAAREVAASPIPVAIFALGRVHARASAGHARDAAGKRRRGLFAEPIAQAEGVDHDRAAARPGSSRSSETAPDVGGHSLSVAGFGAGEAAVGGSFAGTASMRGPLARQLLWQRLLFWPTQYVRHAWLLLPKQCDVQAQLLLPSQYVVHQKRLLLVQ
jgi:hypothetical protein